MHQQEIRLKPGTLWKSIKKTTELALKSGALKSIPTELEIIEQAGVKFVVRILENINRKNADKAKIALLGHVLWPQANRYMRKQLYFL